MKTVKFFRKSDLLEAAHQATSEGWNFNRQISHEYAERLEDWNFPVIFTLPHEHRQGEPCEKHVRCVVAVFKSLQDHTTCKHLIVDVPMSFYENLPSMEVPEKEKVQKSV